MTFDQPYPASPVTTNETYQGSVSESHLGTLEACIKKRKRHTAAQRRELLAMVKSGYLSGNPPYAIMLQLGLSQTLLQGLLVELFTKGGVSRIDPKFSVIEGTESIKKQLNVQVNWPYIKITAEADGSYRLSEYEVSQS